MIRGIGVDMTSISRIRHVMETLSEGALARMFTPAEIEASGRRSVPEEYLAARFAAKEAVFKALAPLVPKGTFDCRIVETLNRPDGSPYVHVTDALRTVMQMAGVSRLLISISTEGDAALAFVTAVYDPDPSSHERSISDVE